MGEDIMISVTVARERPGSAPLESQRMTAPRPEREPARAPAGPRAGAEKAAPSAAWAMPNGDPPDAMLWGDGK